MKSKFLIMLVLLALWPVAANANGEILIFSTSDSQFDPGVDNQGWWSDTASNYDENDN